MLALCVAGAVLSVVTPHSVAFSVDEQSGAYSLAVDGETWYESSPPTVCIAGELKKLRLVSAAAASGSDGIGDWKGPTLTLAAAPAHAVAMAITFKHYVRMPNVSVATATFPAGLATAGCGSNVDLSTSFPAFRTQAGRASSLHTLSWRGQVLSNTAASMGLGALNASGLDCGPVVSTEPSTGTTLVWSTLTSHKILPQRTTLDTYAMGLSASIPSIPPNYSYSVVFTASGAKGATAAMYEWGSLMKAYHKTARSPSVTLTDIGYYTDDGAYYYVWEAFGIPARPWPAEEGLIKVKEQLHRSGVPVAYMQLE